MPFEDQDKTEAPTPRRLQEARERGQIPRSMDLTSALLMLGGLLSLNWLARALTGNLFGFMRGHLGEAEPGIVHTIDVASVVKSVGLVLMYAAGPLMVGLVILAVLANMLQVGFIYTTHPLMPAWHRLNPLQGIARFFSARTVVQLVMNLVKLTIVGWVAYRAIVDRIENVLLALEVGGWQQVVVMGTVLFDVGVRIAAALLVLAILDYGWQRWRHGRDLRMTKDEVKEELRRMEGDPLIKQRRRRMQFAALMQQIKKAVPKADVVVTNPTELAVAIQYQAESMAAPRVVAKGQGFVAQKIREIAAMHGVPIVERKPLAQALFKLVEVGQEVPEKFYQAIAEILAYVYELSGKAGSMRKKAS